MAVGVRGVRQGPMLIYSLAGESPGKPRWVPVRHVLPFTDKAIVFLVLVGVGWVVFVAVVSVFRPRPIWALWRSGALAMFAQWLLNWYVCGGSPAASHAGALRPLFIFSYSCWWLGAPAHPTATPHHKCQCLTPFLLLSVLRMLSSTPPATRRCTTRLGLQPPPLPSVVIQSPV